MLHVNIRGDGWLQAIPDPADAAMATGLDLDLATALDIVELTDAVIQSKATEVAVRNVRSRDAKPVVANLMIDGTRRSHAAYSGANRREARQATRRDFGPEPGRGTQ